MSFMDAELNPKLIERASFVGGAKLANHVCGEFGITSYLSSGVASFGHGVMFIVSTCANKQVLRVCAGRVIAVMAYLHSYWDGLSNVVFKHPSVNTDRFRAA